MAKPAVPIGLQLPLFIDKQKEIDGVGMGVLSDGTAFLTGRGLARLCGIGNARIVELGQQWSSPTPGALTKSVRNILKERGINIDNPYVAIKQKGGDFYAYPDALCLAVLEYYAFEQPTEQGKKNFRLLAGRALHDFIYAQVGYDPADKVPEVWRQFHDRVSLVFDAVPDGYFGIFKEIADIIVHLGQNGLPIDSTFVPDISVGLAWSKHWVAEGLEDLYGARIRFEHNFPSYFPQADSNPQEPWCYPEMALGEFRRWLRETYIGEGKFEKYLTAKVKENLLPASFVQLALAAYSDDDSPKQLK